jgi:hypothetical protein
MKATPSGIRVKDDLDGWTAVRANKKASFRKMDTEIVSAYFLKMLRMLPSACRREIMVKDKGMN